MKLTANEKLKRMKQIEQAREDAMLSHIYYSQLSEIQKIYDSLALANINRYKLQKKATPKWASKKYIRLFNKLAKESSKNGIKYEVDHIIPITHKKVCGLHCEFNLQIISKEENSKKRNSFDINETFYFYNAR